MKLRRHLKIHKRVRQCFSVLLVLCIVMGTGSPGIAIATGLGHQHDDSCYVERNVCELEEHDESCYEECQELICTIREDEGHTHDDSCYDVVRHLVCGMEEHETYRRVKVLECGYGAEDMLQVASTEDMGTEPEQTEEAFAGEPQDQTAEEGPAADTEATEENAEAGTESQVPEGDPETGGDAQAPEEDAEAGTESQVPEGDPETGGDAQASEEDAGAETEDQRPEGDPETEEDAQTPEEETGEDTESQAPEKDSTAGTDNQDSEGDSDGQPGEEFDAQPGEDSEDAEEIPDGEAPGTEQNPDATETDEELEKQIEELNDMIEELPSQEEIATSLTLLEEDRDAWYAYHRELREQMMEACSAYLELEEEQRGQVEGVEELFRRMALRKEIEDSFLEKPVYCEEELHVHANLEGCYDEEDEPVCGMETHAHWEAMECYDQEGVLVCELEEHIHDGECFRIPGITEEQQQAIEQVSRWIADFPEEDEILENLAGLEEADKEEYEAYVTALTERMQEAYDAYMVLPEELRQYVQGEEYLLALQGIVAEIRLDDSEVPDSLPEWVASIPVEGSGQGKMVLELRYGQEKKRHDELEAQVQSPHWGMTGYFDLYAKDVEGDLCLEDLKVTLHIPKAYIKKESVKFEKMPTSINHQISDVTEKDDYYEITVTFPEYRQTGQMQYQFDMSFVGGIVPVDYDLKIFATISSGDESDDTAENIYRPEYKKPRIVKYVNTNQYDSMSQDYTRVAAIVNDDGVIADTGYVSFWYKLGEDSWFLREYDQITLTDILPVYQKYVRNDNGIFMTDENGDKVTEEAVAVFDESANPGWTLGEDGKTVSCVIETSKSCINPTDQDGDDKHWRAATDLKNKIQNAELKLRFPDCVIDEEAKDGFLKKDLTNQVEADCHPHKPSEGEKNDVVEDELIFTLTNQPVGAGFAKYNSSNVVMDTKNVREGLYRWGIRFENTESAIPLENISLTDYELDKRLKICTLRLDTENKNEYQAANRIDQIVAETYDGQADTYTADQFKEQIYKEEWGHYQELVLNPEKEYKGFTVYMKDGYTLKLGENIHIGVYTTFREPDKKQYIEGDKDDKRNLYHNGAKVNYKLQNTFYEIVSGNNFSLIAAKENISIHKEIMYGDQVELGTKDKFWLLEIRGSLQDGKDYEDMKIIDLLPEPVELPTDENGKRNISFGTGDKYVKESLIVDNYKNTGRTAVILYLDVDEVRATLDTSDQANPQGSKIQITLKTEVPLDARVGLFTNEVWLLSDDFEPVTSQNSKEDVYDLDNDGDCAERIRMSEASCTIKAPSGIYAEKAIAPYGSNSWRTSDLFLGVGDRFQYRLSVINAADSNHKGLVVYDVLPTIGDRNISNSAGRGSEYRVELSQAITPPEGYKVYYTSSEEVYSKPMDNILGNNNTNPNSNVVWKDTVSEQDLGSITAFQFVAEEETVIQAKGRAEFVIPVKVVDTLAKDSYDMLEKKQSADRDSGTATYLVSTNSFGYRVRTFSGSNLESNYVRAQIPFAGFVIKKVDAENPETALSGAEFKLEKQNSAANLAAEGGAFSDTGGATELGSGGETWETIAANLVSGADGILSFRNLTEGTYRLTETKAPQGYMALNEPITVTITLDRVSMEYSVSIAGNEHAGNGKDPFLIENRKEVFYELPSTGGPGTGAFAAMGILLMSGSGLCAFYGRKKRT